jgi:hypothetical protein
MGPDSSGRARHQRFEAVGRSASRKNARGTGLRSRHGEVSLRRPCQAKKARGRLPPAGQTACPLIFCRHQCPGVQPGCLGTRQTRPGSRVGGAPLADPHRAAQLSGAARVLCDCDRKTLAGFERGQSPQGRSRPLRMAASCHGPPRPGRRVANPRPIPHFLVGRSYRFRRTACRLSIPVKRGFADESRVRPTQSHIAFQPITRGLGRTVDRRPSASYLYFWDALRYCGMSMDFVLGGFHETTQAYNG